MMPTPIKQGPIVGIGRKQGGWPTSKKKYGK